MPSWRSSGFCLLLTSEHIGHQVVTSNVVGRDLIKDPGLHRSLFADYFASALSGLIGGVPTTTYGEHRVMAITRVYSVRVIAGAAIFSMVMSLLRTVGGTDFHHSW